MSYYQEYLARVTFRFAFKKDTWKTGAEVDWGAGQLD